MSSYSYFPVDPSSDPEPLKPKRRNARARVLLTELGQDALKGYRECVTSAQAGDGGRDALEKAQASWAGSCGLEPHDALILSELDDKSQTILELTRALDNCGMKRPDVEGAIDRLTAQMLAEPAISGTNGR